MHTNPGRAPRSPADLMRGGDSRSSVPIFLALALGNFPFATGRMHGRCICLANRRSHFARARGVRVCACCPARSGHVTIKSWGPPTNPRQCWRYFDPQSRQKSFANVRLPPGEAVRGPSSSSTALDAEPTAQTDPKRMCPGMHDRDKRSRKPAPVSPLKFRGIRLRSRGSQWLFRARSIAFPPLSGRPPL
jgi:hypothetical protein